MFNAPLTPAYIRRLVESIDEVQREMDKHPNPASAERLVVMRAELQARHEAMIYTLLNALKMRNGNSASDAALRLTHMKEDES